MFSPKRIYRLFNKWIRHIHIIKETKIASNPETKKYIRAKRNIHNLPDTWNTQWIKKIKSWKARSKKPHQYNKHKMSNDEINYFYNNAFNQQELLYILSKLKDDEWLEIQTKDKQIISGYYKSALELYEKGIIDGQCICNQWEFNDYGHIKIFKEKILLRVRLLK